MQNKLTLIGFALAIEVIIADQVSKFLVLDFFRNGAAKMMLNYPVTDFFDLVLVWNRGVSFGMFNNGNATPWVLMLLAAVLVALVSRWLLKAQTKLEAAAFGLIIGGAVGNVIDRIRFGAVVDFLDFHVGDWHYPAFNVADSAIVIGAGIILYLWLRQAKTEG